MKCVCVCERAMWKLTQIKHRPGLPVYSRGATHSIIFLYLFIYFPFPFFAPGHIDSSRAVGSDMTAGDVWARPLGRSAGMVGGGGKRKPLPVFARRVLGTK